MKVTSSTAVKGIGLFLTLVLSVILELPSQAATTPNVPFCYQLTIAQYNAPSFSGSPVPCTATHNAVVYAFGAWVVPSGINSKANALNQKLSNFLNNSPYSISEADRTAMTTLICKPKIPPNPTFNNWGWFLMSPSDYAHGVRTVRCIGIKADNPDKPSQLYTWSKTPYPPKQINAADLSLLIKNSLSPGLQQWAKSLSDLGADADANKSISTSRSEVVSASNAISTVASKVTGYLDFDNAVSKLSVDIKLLSDAAKINSGTPLQGWSKDRYKLDLQSVLSVIKKYEINPTPSSIPAPSTPVDKSNGIWDGVISVTKDGGNVGLSCYTISHARVGDMYQCTAYVKALNVSKLPQSLEGLFFAQVDGKIYQSSEPYMESITYNPGEWNSWRVNFKLPYGGSVSDIYLAVSATSPHEFDAPFNVKISN
jgi:hypothetical protein